MATSTYTFTMPAMVAFDVVADSEEAARTLSERFVQELRNGLDGAGFLKLDAGYVVVENAAVATISDVDVIDEDYVAEMKED